ncbi:MAG: T9SS type A sorting domain-containing protein [Bacteroidales bacterium]|nr:T9SS type A sorting domain-containing protein [Bacteroidales bacterium]
MRKVSLLLALAVGSLTAFSQVNRPSVIKADAECAKSAKEAVSVKTSNQGIKAPGDVIWSEDFENGIPAGWTLTDDANNGGWVLTDTAYTGRYTNPLYAELDGVAGDDKYLHLPADFYNCVPGVWPREMVDSPVNMDATVETDYIQLNGVTSAILTYKTWFRLCCSSSSTKIDVNVTFDGNTWITLDGRNINGNVVGINDYPAQDEDYTAIPSYDLTQFITDNGATQLKFQFRMQGGSHYFVSIDDISLVEPLENDLVALGAMSVLYPATGITNISDDPVWWYSYNSRINEIPYNMESDMTFALAIRQAGAQAVNARVDFQVLGNETSDFSSLVTMPTFNLGAADTILVSDYPGFDFAGTNGTLTLADYQNNAWMENGKEYTFTYTAASDNADDITDNNALDLAFAQTYGRFSYHNLPTVNPDATGASWAGPFDWALTQGSGDGMANNFDIYTIDGSEFKVYGFRVYFPADALTFDGSGNGVVFIPFIDYYDEAASAWVDLSGDVFADAFQLHTEDGNTFKYITFEGADAYDFAPGTYRVGIYVDDLNGCEWAVGTDFSENSGSYGAARFMDASTTDWAWWYDEAIMIDAYVNIEQMDYDIQLGMGVKEVASTNSTVKVYPNPTSGLVKVDNAQGATINVYSVTGALVYTLNNAAVTANVDLSNLANGTYIVKVVNANETTTAKINLMK